MLPNFGQIASLLKNAGQIKQNMAEMNEKLAAARFSGEAGGGQIKAIVDGRGELVSLKIDPALVQAGDVEMLEDLVCAAVRGAIRESRTGAQQELQGALGGLGLNMPGLTDLLGGK